MKQILPDLTLSLLALPALAADQPLILPMQQYPTS